MAGHEGVKERAGLRVEAGIRLDSEDSRQSPRNRRLEQPDIADLCRSSEHGLGGNEQVLQVDVLGHMLPSRRSRSVSSGEDRRKVLVTSACPT